MNKLFLPVALSACAAGAFGQTRMAQVPGSFRHPDAFAYLPTPVAYAETVNFAISLQPRDPAGLQKFVDGVSDPASPQYRQFITPDEVGVRFGPAQADVNATKQFLTASGLTVDSVAKNNFVITAHGSARQVSAAFQTRLGYVPRAYFTGHPGTLRTNLSPLMMPSTLAGKVVSIDGIDTSIEHVKRSTTTFLNPTLFRACYNASPQFQSGFNGQGVKIGVSNWDGYRLENIPFLVNTFHLPVPSGGVGSNIIVVQVGTGTTDGAGSPGGEGDLDIQSEMAAAPLATIYVYDDSQTDTGAPITTLSKIASDNLVDICSESYGWFTAGLASTFTSAHNIHLSMSAQGITYLAASGDNAMSDISSQNARDAYPDIDPEVLMVGGTEDTVDAGTGVRQISKPWGLLNGEGATGGYDPIDTPSAGFAFNAPPAYQTKNIGSQTGQYPYRLIPDVAAVAAGQDGIGNNDGTGWGYLIFYGGSGTGIAAGTQVPIDGTSIASPITAGGLAAVYSQYFAKVTPNSSRSNVRLGRIQDLLYANGTNGVVFYDVTTGGNVGILPNTSTTATPGPGWDFATGWGSINFNGLYGLLSGTLATTVVNGIPVQPAMFGTYVGGTLNSSGTYNISSSNYTGLGQVAGAEIDFTATVPVGDVIDVAKLTIAANSVSGSTEQLYFYNWTTKAWDYIGANPMFGTTVTKTYNLTTSTYVGSNHEVRIVSRGVLPSRLGTNSFTYKLSTATVAFGAAPKN